MCIKIPFLEFRLLLSRVAPSLQSLPKNVWLSIKIQIEIIEMLIVFLRYQKYCTNKTLQSHET